MVEWETSDDFGQFLWAAINEAEFWQRFKRTNALSEQMSGMQPFSFLVSCCDNILPAASLALDAKVPKSQSETIGVYSKEGLNSIPMTRAGQVCCALLRHL